MLVPTHDSEGRWFGRQGWWVYPKCTGLNERTTPNILKSGYDEQAKWDFSKFGSTSIDDPTELLREFKRVSHEASEAFDWTTTCPSHDPTSRDPWNINKHGWKHVSFRDFLDKARSVREMRDKSALRRTVFAVSPDEFERLISGARNEEPEDVARLWHLLGNGEHLRPALHYWFEFRITPEEIESFIADIPNPILLGTSYLEQIFANPGKGTSDASKRLKKLCSVGFIQGTGPQGGHPRLPHNWADIVFVRGMAYGLVKQIRHARTFLRKRRHPSNRIAQTSLDCLGVDDATVADLVQHVGFANAPIPDNFLANKLAAKMLSTPDLPVTPWYVKKVLNAKRPE
jgi:hypothetical protein